MWAYIPHRVHGLKRALRGWLHCTTADQLLCMTVRMYDAPAAASEHLVGVHHIRILIALVPPLPLLLAAAVRLASPRTAPPCAVALIFLLCPQPPAHLYGWHCGSSLTR